MKVIIAGSRSIHSYVILETAVEAALAEGFILDEIVSGCAQGVDALGEEYAYKHKIPLKLFPADWDNLGKGAGHERNWRMAQYVGPAPEGALIAIWDTKSKGTKNMIQIAKERGCKVYVYEV